MYTGGGTGLSDFPVLTKSAQEVDRARGLGGKDIDDCTDPEDIVERPDSERTSTSFPSISTTSELQESFNPLSAGFFSSFDTLLDAFLE